MLRALNALACLLLAGCGPLLSRGGDLDPERYKTPVAKAQDAGLTVYWLGLEFDADGVPFDMIESKYPEGVAGIAVSGVEMHYFQESPRRGNLDVLTFSETDWDRVEQLVRYPVNIDSAIMRKTVKVVGRDAELLSIPLGARPINSHHLILDYGRFVVLAQTNSALDAGGRDVNPLMNEQVFLEVMQNLRRYPN